MNFTHLIVLAVGVMNVAAGRLIVERRLNREFNMCGPQLFAVLGRICGTHRYDPESSYVQAQNAEKPSISSMCCAKKCRVVDVITTFCPNKRFPGGQTQPKPVAVVPPSDGKSTTSSSVSIVKMTTTTEKLASIWFLTG